MWVQSLIGLTLTTTTLPSRWRQPKKLFLTGTLLVSLSLLAGCQTAPGGPSTGQRFNDLIATRVYKIPANALRSSNADGRYSVLLQKLSCPSDAAKYGPSGDYGYWGGGQWCGQAGRSGYWVWVAPNWYIWQNRVMKADRPAVPQPSLQP